MNELNYLVFLLNNRLGENYSIKNLRIEISNRIAELLKGKQGEICQECGQILGTCNGCMLCEIFNDVSCEGEDNE